MITLAMCLRALFTLGPIKLCLETPASHRFVCWSHVRIEGPPELAPGMLLHDGEDPMWLLPDEPQGVWLRCPKDSRGPGGLENALVSFGVVSGWIFFFWF